MPDQSGLDVLRVLQSRDPAWPVIMVSGTTNVDDAIQAFQRGASHFLRKPFRCEALGQALFEANRIATARLMDHQRRVAATSISLTPRERDVLAAIGRGEQTKIIAWKLGLSVRTIDMHRTNILAKLDARNAVQAVATARELGLITASAA
jgi:two-component system response regulator FixJ